MGSQKDEDMMKIKTDLRHGCENLVELFIGQVLPVNAFNFSRKSRMDFFDLDSLEGLSLGVASHSVVFQLTTR